MVYGQNRVDSMPSTNPIRQEIKVTYLIQRSELYGDLTTLVCSWLLHDQLVA